MKKNFKIRDSKFYFVIKVLLINWWLGFKVKCEYYISIGYLVYLLVCCC